MRFRSILPLAWLFWLAASVDTMAADVAHTAFVQANAAIQKLQASGRVPNMSDGAYAALVSQAFDSHVLESDGDESLTDVLAICRNATRSLHGYSYFGIDQATLTPARVSELRRQNVLRFQDELALSLAFNFACQAKMVLKLQDFWTGLNDSEKADKKSFILQYRDNLPEQLSYQLGSLSALSRPTNHQILLDALVHDCALIAATMTREARRDTIAVIEKAAASPDLSPDDRKKLTAIQHAMTQTKCDPLCALR